MIYRYINSLLLKFSIRYFSYINGCHTVIIPLFITPPPLPRIFLFPVSTKKRHIKYGKNIIMSVLLKTIVADYSLRQRELLTLLTRSVIVSNNVSATQDDVSECQSIACTLNKIISSTGYKFWAFFFLF